MRKIMVAGSLAAFALLGTGVAQAQADPHPNMVEQVALQTLIYPVATPYQTVTDEGGSGSADLPCFDLAHVTDNDGVSLALLQLCWPSGSA